MALSYLKILLSSHNFSFKLFHKHYFEIKRRKRRSISLNSDDEEKKQKLKKVLNAKEAHLLHVKEILQINE